MKNKGVTLIALIITIILLLILSAITLTLVLGENGIIEKARLAKEKTNIAQEKEEKDISELENKVNEYESTRAGGTTKTKILSKEFLQLPLRSGDWLCFENTGIRFIYYKCNRKFNYF